MDVVVIDDGINNKMYNIGDLFCDVEIAQDFSVRKNKNTLFENGIVGYGVKRDLSNDKNSCFYEQR